MTFKKLKWQSISTAIFFAILFHSCSWQEYFVIFNESKNAINLAYRLSEVHSGFPIFTTQASCYAGKNHKISWEKPVEPFTSEQSTFAFTGKLEPGYVLIIGHLSNDKYLSYNQNFINGRQFNLVSLQITSAEKTLNVIPENFDSCFKKRNGIVGMVVK